MSDYSKYRKNFMPEGYYGTCAKTCILGILNYFYYSYFNTQDFDNVFKLANFGHKTSDDIPELIEMAYFFDRLKFDVTYSTSMTPEDFKVIQTQPMDQKIATYLKYLPENLHKHVQGNYRVESGHDIKMDIYKEDYIKLINSNTSMSINHTDNILGFINKYQQPEGVLFLLGLSAKLLYNYDVDNDEVSGGHVVVSTGIIDDKFVIYEPGYPAPEPQYIDIPTVIKAMEAFGDIQMVVIKEHAE